MPRVELTDALGEALESLARHPLRSSLSALGVVLGVAAIVSVLSVASGAQQAALADVQALGLDNLVARSAGTSAYPADWRGLVASDTGLLDALGLVREHAAVVVRQLRVSAGGRARVSHVLGVEASFASIVRLRIERGRFLAGLEDHGPARTCVLGRDLAQALFDDSDPLGQWIRIGDDSFLVVGVLTAQGSTQRGGGLAWHPIDETVFVPLASMTGHSLDVAPTQPTDEIWLRLRRDAPVERAGGVLRHALDVRGVTQAAVVVPRELLAQRTRTQTLFAALVASVAGLVLLVSGIGIMNVLLMSVTERTHEIGVRRTVGATRRSIGLQFLVEALVMTAGGGIGGVALGVLASRALTALAGWPTTLPPEAMALAFGVALGVGVLAGFYPARVAAALEPADALRHE